MASGIEHDINNAFLDSRLHRIALAKEPASSTYRSYLEHN